LDQYLCHDAFREVFRGHMRKLLVKDQIAEEVRRRIADGRYAPGDSMPTERELAREFRTSRTTISQALLRLQTMGLIEQAPGRGTRVLALTERPARGAVGVFYTGQPPFALETGLLIEALQQSLAARSQHSELVGGDDRVDLTADDIVERFSGALFVEGLGYEGLMLELEERHFPYVVANLEKDLNLTCTFVDHRRTTRTAVRMLAALGHRRIALLTRAEEFFFYRKAGEGYRAGLEDASIPVDESLVLYAEQTGMPTDSVGAYVAVREYLESNPPPTGLVACRDYLACGACRALEEAGLVVGRDVSVIGFDDLSWPSENPTLTTFSEPTHALGTVAVEMLVERLISGWQPVEKREVESPLVLRKSVGPCWEEAEEGGPCRVLLTLHHEDTPVVSKPPLSTKDVPVLG
jgi:DNA-binding LacI/PurR family transcriptional regulator